MAEMTGCSPNIYSLLTTPDFVLGSNVPPMQLGEQQADVVGWS